MYGSVPFAINHVSVSMSVSLSIPLEYLDEVSANGFKGVQYVRMGRWPFVYGSVAFTINHVSVSMSVSLSISIQYPVYSRFPTNVLL